MQQQPIEHIISKTADQPLPDGGSAQKIVNGVSVVLPLLAAAYGVERESRSINDNLVALMAHCRRLIDGVKIELGVRGISLVGGDEGVVHAACLNAVLMGSREILVDDVQEDITHIIGHVLTSLDVAKTREIATGEKEGMPLTMAAAMESAAAVAIYVLFSRHPELAQQQDSVRRILSSIDYARSDAAVLLHLDNFSNKDDVDKINAVITREISRVMIAVIDRGIKFMKMDFCLENAMAEGMSSSSAFVNGIAATFDVEGN